MALSIKQIRGATTNDELLGLLTGELKLLFPPELRDDPIVYCSQLQGAPTGLRAMASTYELDVSMALDDLAWHFVNHHSLQELADETILGLRELEENEAAKIFAQAFAIVKPHWREFENVGELGTAGDIHAWLDSTGIQKLIDPLNDQMWKTLKRWPNYSLMDCWVAYASKYPERCIKRT